MICVCSQHPVPAVSHLCMNSHPLQSHRHASSHPKSRRETFRRDSRVSSRPAGNIPLTPCQRNGQPGSVSGASNILVSVALHVFLSVLTKKTRRAGNCWESLRRSSFFWWNECLDIGECLSDATGPEDDDGRSERSPRPRPHAEVLSEGGQPLNRRPLGNYLSAHFDGKSPNRRCGPRRHCEARVGGASVRQNDEVEMDGARSLFATG